MVAWLVLGTFLAWRDVSSELITARALSIYPNPAAATLMDLAVQTFPFDVNLRRLRDDLRASLG